MALLACACAGAPEDADLATQPLVLDFEPIAVQAGEELIGLCQSLTLNNDEAIAVNAVTMDAGPAWHHANWFFVPEDLYDGPDGTWDCNQRDFDTVVAGLRGSVLFAMSTQAQTEEQRFQPGAALVIPPHSRIVGELHLINASDAMLSTGLSLTVEPMAVEDVQAWLQPATFVYYDLDIPPMATSEFAADCDLEGAWGAPLDLRVHYVLPHYHNLGRAMNLQVIGGPNHGQTIYDVESGIGEPLSATLDPPVDLTGATGVRFSCTFQNDTESPVGWGLGGREMCVALAFVDGPAKWGGQVEFDSVYVGEDNGVMRYTGPCETLAILGH
jgi:hypothetical protein